MTMQASGEREEVVEARVVWVSQDYAKAVITKNQELRKALHNLHAAVWKNCGKVRLLRMRDELEAAEKLCREATNGER